jgi:hypothetical protein
MREQYVSSFLITFSDVDGEGSSLDMIRNFGEHLFSTFREGDSAFVDLGEVDHCVDRFHVFLRKKSLSRTVAQMIENALYNQGMRRATVVLNPNVLQ